MPSIGNSLREFALPVRSLSTLLTIITFVLLFALVAAAGMFGLWLALVIVPAFTRYLMLVLEARACDREPPTPGIELFSWVSEFWSLFPLLPVAGVGAVALYLHDTAGYVAASVLLLVAALFLPASFAVLAITHSPLESLNPYAIGRFLRRAGAGYWVAPAAFVLAMLAMPAAAASPALLRDLAGLWLFVAAFAVTGAVVRGAGLLAEIDLPEDAGRAAAAEAALGERRRTAVLNHAYGFASRGNIEGALDEIEGALGDEADRDAASAWFFDRMLAWQDRYAALRFAQLWLSRLLAEGDEVRAVKLMLRCRMIDDRFRPLPVDLPRARQAAAATRNEDLARALG